MAVLVIDLVEFVIGGIVCGIAYRIAGENAGRVIGTVEPVGLEAPFGAMRVALGRAGIARLDAEQAFPDIELAAHRGTERRGVLAPELQIARGFGIAEPAGGRCLIEDCVVVRLDAETEPVLSIGKFGIEHSDISAHGIGRSPIEIGDQPGALADDMVLAQRVLKRDVGAVDHIPMTTRLRVLRFDRALRIIRRKDDAELLVRPEQRAERYVALDRVRFPQTIVTDGPGCGDERLAAIERIHRFDIRAAGDRVRVEIGRECLHHRHRTDQSRWNVIKLHLARVGLGRRGGLAVERDVEQIGRHAAHGEIAPLTLIVGDTEAGQAAQRFRHVLVGKAPDVIRAHLADLPRRLALGLKRGAIGGSPAGDDDLTVHILVVDLGLGQRRLDAEQRRTQQARTKRQSQRGSDHPSSLPL